MMCRIVTGRFFTNCMGLTSHLSSPVIREERMDEIIVIRVFVIKG